MILLLPTTTTQVSQTHHFYLHTGVATQDEAITPHRHNLGVDKNLSNREAAKPRP
jgi:hypothetical protein